MRSSSLAAAFSSAFLPAMCSARIHGDIALPVGEQQLAAGRDGSSLISTRARQLIEVAVASGEFAEGLAADLHVRLTPGRRRVDDLEAELLEARVSFPSAPPGR